MTSPAPSPAAPIPPSPGADIGEGWAIPRLDPSDRWVGGVAAAIAREVGVETVVIRVSFVLLALAGGWGLVLYALSWILLAIKQPTTTATTTTRQTVSRPKGATAFHRYVAVAMIVLGLILAASNSSFFEGGSSTRPGSS